MHRHIATSNVSSCNSWNTFTFLNAADARHCYVVNSYVLNATTVIHCHIVNSNVSKCNRCYTMPYNYIINSNGSKYNKM